MEEIQPFKEEEQTLLFKDPVRTAQKTLFNLATNTGAEFAVCS